MQSDEELVFAYRDGDDRAFTTLVERYLRTVYSLAARLTGSTQDAEDIVQETFLRVWKNIQKYSPEQARFKTWLMHIARNTTIDHLRKRKELPFSVFEDAEGDSSIPELVANEVGAEELFARGQDAQELERVVEQLAFPYREVLLLHYGSDLTFDEISKVLDTSINTVKSRHRRALIALRKLLAHQT